MREYYKTLDRFKRVSDNNNNKYSTSSDFFYDNISEKIDDSIDYRIGAKSTVYLFNKYYTRPQIVDLLKLILLGSEEQLAIYNDLEKEQVIDFWGDGMYSDDFTKQNPNGKSFLIIGGRAQEFGHRGIICNYGIVINNSIEPDTTKTLSKFFKLRKWIRLKRK